jgi:activator of HSP90 ATPase
MSERGNQAVMAALTTRRRLIASGTVALAGMVLNKERAMAQQNMGEKQSTGPDYARTSLHQEIEFKASPHRIYEILLDSKQFSAFSGEPAEISREAGGAFSMFGGKIMGRNIELVPDERIVQAWRPAYWKPGEYTIVKFELKPDGSQTKLLLDHTGFHEGDFAHLDPGWKIRYWDPLTKYLG